MVRSAWSRLQKFESAYYHQSLPVAIAGTQKARVSIKPGAVQSLHPNPPVGSLSFTGSPLT